VEDLSEKEQLEAFKAWWAENGNYVMGGMALGIAVIFGWNRWESNIAETEIAASTLYENIMDASSRGNIDNASFSANELFENYATSPYAAHGRFAMARLYMDNGRDQDAVDVLQAVIDSHPNDELSLVARLRLAKILLYQGRAETILDLLQDLPESAFDQRFSEVLGDAYVALESYAEAEAAYISALGDGSAIGAVDQSLIKLKINDLPLISEEDSPSESSESEELIAEDGAGDQ